RHRTSSKRKRSIQGTYIPNTYEIDQILKAPRETVTKGNLKPHQKLSSGNHLVDGRIDRPTYRHIQLLTKFGEPGGVNYGKKYQPGLLDEGINQKFHGFNQHLGDQGVYQDQHGESTGLRSWVNYSVPGIH
ncbi:hypothetical protein DPMN_079150, partial [Dreissena polymorpha]